MHFCITHRAAIYKASSSFSIHWSSTASVDWSSTACVVILFHFHIYIFTSVTIAVCKNLAFGSRRYHDYTCDAYIDELPDDATATIKYYTSSKAIYQANKKKLPSHSDYIRARTTALAISGQSRHRRGKSPLALCSAADLLLITWSHGGNVFRASQTALHIV